MDLPVADGLEVMLTREQPANGMHHPLLATSLRPREQEQEQIGGQHGVTMPTALAALDPQQYALAADVADLELGNFRGAQARAIGYRHDRLVLDAGRRVQHPRNSRG